MKKVSMLSAAAAVAVAGASIVPAVSVLAWGDSSNGRTAYTIDQIENDVLGDNVVFNSIEGASYVDANNVEHKLGDERNFVRTRVSGTHDVWSSNEIVAEDGKEYVLSLYVHNNNPKETVVAENTKVSFSIPGNSATSIDVNGYISADNATPNKYWDNVIFKSNDGAAFHLEYVAGSALWESNGASAGALSDDIITSDGVLVGYDALDGKIPGCYQYSGYASVRVKVVYDYAFAISKVVRIKGTTTWSETVDAKIGDVVEYMISYKNLSGATATDVMVQDFLPNNMEYIAGTTKIKNANHQNGAIVSDGITTTGINIGDYTNNSDAALIFEAKVVNRDLVCSKTNQLVNWVKITASGSTRKDPAIVTIAKSCPGELPNTGATPVAATALGAGSIVTALGYFIASRKK